MKIRSDSRAYAGQFDARAYDRARRTYRVEHQSQRVVAVALGIGYAVTLGTAMVRFVGAESIVGPRRIFWGLAFITMALALAAAWRLNPSDELRSMRRRIRAQRRTAGLCRGLSAQNWVVLHDRRIGTIGPAVQHVVVGPPGILVLESQCSLGWRPRLMSSCSDAGSQLASHVGHDVDCLKVSVPPWWPLFLPVWNTLLHLEQYAPEARLAPDDVRALAQRCVVWCSPRIRREPATLR